MNLTKWNKKAVDYATALMYKTIFFSLIPEVFLKSVQDIFYPDV